MMRETSLAVFAMVAMTAAGLRTGLSASSGQDQQPPRHTEHVTVSRILLDARAVDSRGQPIRGLTASHFKVRVDGKPGRVESAEWVGQEEPPVQRAEAVGQGGRLIVLLFQKDLEPTRIVGLMRMLIDTREFLDSLGPDDRVAVLSFDTHLRNWLDFTTDLDKVRDVLQRGILFKYPTRVEPVPSPALMSTLDIVRADRAYSMEDVLALLGQALEPLPGSKSVVLVGHGFGQLSGGTLNFQATYGEARRALQAARAAVFCLDVTDADSHTLEAGLEMTAADTGGFYARTHLFPGLAMARLAGALSGHYVLFVEVTAPTTRQVHDIEVDLVGVDGVVLAKRSYLTAQ
jgi:VWFA-related protein